MDIVNILIAILVVGAVLYIVSILPIHPTVKQIAYVVGILLLAIWLIRAFAPLTGFG